MRWLSGKTLRKCIAWAKFFQAKPFLVTLKMHKVTTNTILLILLITDFKSNGKIVYIKDTTKKYILIVALKNTAMFQALIFYLKSSIVEKKLEVKIQW